MPHPSNYSMMSFHIICYIISKQYFMGSFGKIFLRQGDRIWSSGSPGWSVVPSSGRRSEYYSSTNVTCPLLQYKGVQEYNGRFAPKVCTALSTELHLPDHCVFFNHSIIEIYTCQYRSHFFWRKWIYITVQKSLPWRITSHVVFLWGSACGSHPKETSHWSMNTAPVVFTLSAFWWAQAGGSKVQDQGQIINLCNLVPFCLSQLP